MYIRMCDLFQLSIMLTCPYDVDPLQPTFYSKTVVNMDIPIFVIVALLRRF